MFMIVTTYDRQHEGDGVYRVLCQHAVVVLHITRMTIHDTESRDTIAYKRQSRSSAETFPSSLETNDARASVPDSSVAISAASDTEVDETSDSSSAETREARDDGRVDARDSSLLAAARVDTTYESASLSKVSPRVSRLMERLGAGTPAAARCAFRRTRVANSCEFSRCDNESGSGAGPVEKNGCANACVAVRRRAGSNTRSRRSKSSASSGNPANFSRRVV